MISAANEFREPRVEPRNDRALRHRMVCLVWPRLAGYVHCSKCSGHDLPPGWPGNMFIITFNELDAKQWAKADAQSGCTEHTRIWRRAIVICAREEKRKKRTGFY